MLIFKRKPEIGVCFAWWPVQANEGLVWLEWVQYDLHDGSVTSYRRWTPDYRRRTPERDYAQGALAAKDFTPEQRKAAIRRSWKFCAYPKCGCMDYDTGDVCPGGYACPEATSSDPGEHHQ